MFSNVIPNQYEYKIVCNSLSKEFNWLALSNEEALRLVNYQKLRDLGWQAELCRDMLEDWMEKREHIQSAHFLGRPLEIINLRLKKIDK